MRSLSESIFLALGSPLGKFLFVLTSLLCALLITYAIVCWRGRKRDILASKYREHYLRAEALAVGWSFDAPPRMEFFGRKTVVVDAKGRFALCTIPSPDMATEEVRQRFEDFQWAVQHQRIPGMKGVRLLRGAGMLASLHQGKMDAKGRPYPTVREILLEAHIKMAEAENLLLLLAKSLSTLHDLRSPRGCIPFHGFLLPQSVSVVFGPSGAVSELRLADTGWAYSLGPELMRKRLALLKKGSLLIDRFLGRELLEQLPFLAPETLPGSTEEFFGPESDFYSFGAIAVSLFSEERFVSSDLVNWERLPQKWRPFLKRCLQRNPLQRPKDFLELEEWLSNPELLLTQSVGGAEELDEGGEEVVYDLGELLTRLQEHRSAYQAPARAPEIEAQLETLQKQISLQKWEDAYEVAEKAALFSSDPELRLYQLMAAHELGKAQEVDKLSGELEAEDPHLMRRFRDFITFHA